MLTGILLGILISLLTFGVIYLLGANQTLRVSVKEITAQAWVLREQVKELTDKAEKLMTLMKSVEQPYIIHFTEDQTVRLAQMVLAKIQLIMDANQAKELGKLD